MVLCTMHNIAAKSFYMDSIIIRHAVPADGTTVYRLLTQLSDRINNAVLFDELFEASIEMPNTIYLVAEDNGNIVGFISCHGQVLLHHMGWAYEIQEMFVDAAYRGKGVGKRLLTQLETTLQDTDYDVLEVTSKHIREGAHAFYMANGYEHTHRKFTKKKLLQ